MKKQIISLMLSAAVLAASPVFAMEADLEDSAKAYFSRLPKIQNEPLKEFSERFCAHVKSFEGAYEGPYVGMVAYVFKDISEEERYDVADKALRCFECKPELKSPITILAFAKVKNRSGLLSFLTDNEVTLYHFWDLWKLKENSGVEEWKSIFCRLSDSKVFQEERGGKPNKELIRYEFLAANPDLPGGAIEIRIRRGSSMGIGFINAGGDFERVID